MSYSKKLYHTTIFISCYSNKFLNMVDLAIIAILIGGIVEIIRHNGGIDSLLYFITNKIKSKRGAKFGIAGWVSLVNIPTANNTISIVIAGLLAKSIADEFGVDPRKSTSLLDTFSCSLQGIIPYRTQLLAVSGLAVISPISIIPYSFYPFMIGICRIVAILIGYPKFSQKDKSTYKR